MLSNAINWLDGLTVISAGSVYHKSQHQHLIVCELLDLLHFGKFDQ